MLDVAIVLAVLGLLMFVAYRGLSVVLFAPVCALLAVALSLGPKEVLPFYSHVFMAKLVAFLQLYFPVFLLGAVFGKLIELSGAASSLSGAIIGRLGERHTILAIVLASALLTYGGVSLFVVAFAVYPFAAGLFKRAGIPKRLVPATMALGAFTFTMDALPGTPQIQNVIPTTFFGTTLYAAPFLGCSGALLVLVLGLTYLNRERKKAVERGEGYGEGHFNEPETQTEESPLHPAKAIVPLLTVALANRFLSAQLKLTYGSTVEVEHATVEVSKMATIWSIEIALTLGILLTLMLGCRNVRKGLDAAVAGALLATLNTASEYGFGGVIAALPGFAVVKSFIGGAFANPLVNEAVSINVLAGITGSASGGMSLALGALGQQYMASGEPPEVLHRIASMASGGMDTLPHNGAVITLLLITGLTHRQSYKDIFVLTLIKTLAVFFVIALYTLTGLY